MRVAFAIALLVACKGASKSADQNMPNTGTGSPGNGGGGGLKGDGMHLRQPGELLIEPGDMNAMGDVDKDTVKKVVKSNLEKLQYCYEKTLLANPGIEGKVVVSFTIAIDGAVTNVSAAGIHPDVETCVAEKFRAFRFPAPPAQTQVEYPFTFRPA